MNILSTQQFEKILKESTSGKILYVQNPGNAGDSLIASATLNLFKKLNLDYTAISALKFRTDTPEHYNILIYSGGGNLVDYYTECKNFINTAINSKSIKRIIILPHTIRGNENILSELDSRFLIFCRDKNSYKHISKLNQKAAIYLFPDLAFIYISKNYCANNHLIKILFTLFKNSPQKTIKILFSHLLIKLFPKIKKEVTVFRNDVEKNNDNEKNKNKNIDLPALYGSTFESPAIIRAISCILIKTISLMSEIKTDRLHVAICSIILGKNHIVFYNNSYGKNFDVFDLYLESNEAQVFIKNYLMERNNAAITFKKYNH